MKKEFETGEVQLLFNAFLALCDHMEMERTCGECPLYKNCYDHGNGERYWEILKKVGVDCGAMWGADK